MLGASTLSAHRASECTACGCGTVSAHAAGSDRGLRGVQGVRAQDGGQPQRRPETHARVPVPPAGCAGGRRGPRSDLRPAPRDREPRPHTLSAPRPRRPTRLSPALPQKYYGRKSPIGRDVCRLRKTYYNARHEAAAQIDEIVGETASEADSSETSVSEKESAHEKDDDVIRCVCGLHKDEGLMIQCDKCMVSPRRPGLQTGEAPLRSPRVSPGADPLRAPHFPSLRASRPAGHRTSVQDGASRGAASLGSRVDGASNGGASTLRCPVGEWSQEGQGCAGQSRGCSLESMGGGGDSPLLAPGPWASAGLDKGLRGAVVLRASPHVPRRTRQVLGSGELPFPQS